MTYFWVALAVASFVLAVFGGLRWADSHHDRSVWRELADQAEVSANRYDPDQVRSLPDPAQRYLNFSIAPGTPLVSAVELVMHGELGLGSIDDPRYTPMNATQILAPPHGFVWRVKAGTISGSDGATNTTSWTRFWLLGFAPVVRVSNDENHRRSAFGRVVAEAAFWTPAMLLPCKDVRWEAVDSDTARAIVTYGGFEQSVDLTVAPNGQPEHIVIARWSNENPNRVYQLQPFGGYLGNFRQVGGYMLPTSVEGGNHFGTDQYFPFFKAQVAEIRLLGEPQSR